MKRWTLIFLGMVVILTGCARFQGRKAAPPAQPGEPSVTPAPATQAAPTMTPEPGEEAPDLTAMSFVEKNNLYIQLLNEGQTAGADTQTAEEAYAHSLEASLSGDAQAADRYLEQAIFILLSP
ncbi:MAG: hypothetical protein ACE5E7_13845 [Anaerolineae bacterium]